MVKKLSKLFLALLVLFTPLIGFAQAGMKMPPVVVEVAKAKLIDFQQAINATGTLSAFHGITVRPEIPGRITKIYVKSGEQVAAGEPLIQINPDVYKAQLKQAQAHLTLASLEYQRIGKLFKQKAVAKSDLDKALANLHADQGAVDEAQAHLNQALVRAPFAGKLGLKQVNIGDFIEAGENIVNLQALDPIRVDFSLPENYIGLLKQNQKVILHSDAYPNIDFSGSVYAFESKIDPQTRTLGVRASVPNPKHKLLPGAFVEVTLFAGEEQKVISIPLTSVVYSADGNYVYKIENNQAIKTPVKLGARSSNSIVVLSGLKENDTVVTAGQIKLHDKAHVIIVPTNKKGSK